MNGHICLCRPEVSHIYVNEPSPWLPGCARSRLWTLYTFEYLILSFTLQVLFGPNADDLAARPRPYRYKLLRPGRSGVVFGDLSPAWKLMKRGMMTSMKMFGEGK